MSASSQSAEADNDEAESEDNDEFTYYPQVTQHPTTVIEGDIADIVTGADIDSGVEQTGSSFGVVFENPEVVGDATVWKNRNIPEGFGQSDESSAVDTTPDDLQSPEDDDWEYEDPSDNPDNSEDDLDFGNADPYEDGTAAPEGATTIPDSLADFDPAGRVDLVNQDEDDGGTWVGL